MWTYAKIDRNTDNDSIVSVVVKFQDDTTGEEFVFEDSRVVIPGGRAAFASHIQPVSVRSRSNTATVRDRSYTAGVD